MPGSILFPSFGDPMINVHLSQMQGVVGLVPQSTTIGGGGGGGPPDGPPDDEDEDDDDDEDEGGEEEGDDNRSRKERRRLRDDREIKSERPRISRKEAERVTISSFSRRRHSALVNPCSANAVTSFSLVINCSLVSSIEYTSG